VYTLGRRPHGGQALALALTKPLERTLRADSEALEPAARGITGAGRSRVRRGALAFLEKVELDGGITVPPDPFPRPFSRLPSVAASVEVSFARAL